MFTDGLQSVNIGIFSGILEIMENNNICESYANCSNYDDNINCVGSGLINTPNQSVNIEIDKYNNVYKSSNVNYPNNDLQLNNSVLHLIRWELDYRIQHNKIATKTREQYNIGTIKPIDLDYIIRWYNKQYRSNISKGDLLEFLQQINYNLKELKQWKKRKQL